MRAWATSVWGLKLLVYEALSYCMWLTSATCSTVSVCRMLTYADVGWRMLTYVDVCYLCVWQVVDERYVLYTERCCWRMPTYADVCWHMLTYAMLSVRATGGWRALRALHWAPAPRAAANARGAGTLVVKSSYTIVLFTVYALLLFSLYYFSALLLRRCPPAHYIHCKCGGGWRTWTASLRTLCVCAWPSWSSAWYFFLDTMARSN
jgi:hypothetical protein